jgi:hypothetical protein
MQGDSSAKESVEGNRNCEWAEKISRAGNARRETDSVEELRLQWRGDFNFLGMIGESDGTQG